jgi:hypothetical protein
MLCNYYMILMDWAIRMLIKIGKGKYLYNNAERLFFYVFFAVRTYKSLPSLYANVFIRL